MQSRRGLRPPRGSVQSDNASGVLHANAVAAGREALFITSANLVWIEKRELLALPED